MRLLERDEEMRILGQALAHARDRHGTVVLVHGPAGIGKSSLIRAFAQNAETGGARVAIGACDDLYAPRAFGPLRDVARGESALAQALRAGPGRAEVLDALLEELRDPLTPVLLVLEDVHWADGATLDAIRFVARRIDRLPAVLLVSYRDDEITPAHPLQAVIGGLTTASVRRVPLVALSRAAVAQLAGRSPQAVGDLHMITGGNPFYVREVLAAPDARVPIGVRDAVLARVAALPDRARHGLEVLSVIPGIAERWLVDAVVTDGSGVFDEAERRGIVVADAVTIQFTHELVRRAVESELVTSKRIAYNAAAAAALARGNGHPARILHHAVEAGDGDLVVDHGLAAAREAARLGSHREALAAYRQLHRFADRMPVDQRPSVALEYAYELQLGSLHGQATEIATHAVAVLEQRDDPLRLADGLLVLSRAAYWHRGQAAAMASAERAVELLAGLPLSAVHGMAFAHLARLHLLAYRHQAAMSWAQQALEVATEVGHAATEADALVSRGASRLALGDIEGAEELRRGLALAQLRGFHESAVRAFVHLIRSHLRRCELDEAERVLAEGRDLAARHEVVYGSYRLETQRGLLALARGQHATARAVLQGLIQSEIESTVAGVQPRARLARVLARMDEPLAETLVQQAWQLAQHSGEVTRVGSAAVARVELAWLAQDTDAAREAGEDAIALIDGSGHRWYAGELRVYLARAGVPVGGAPSLLEPHAASLRGDHAAAAALWGKLGYAYEEAVELVDCDDRKATFEGVRRLDLLGAATVANLARVKLRARGVVSVPRGPSSRTRKNAAGLTARQVDVLALLAEGLTNGEIADRLVLSIRTVDHHVSAILNKLGVASRNEAAEHADTLGIGRS